MNYFTIIDQLKMEEQKLQAKVTNLEDEVKQVTSKLEIMTKSVRMLGTGTKKLNEILSIRNHANDPTVVGCEVIYNNETLKSNFFLLKTDLTSRCCHILHHIRNL